MKNKRIHIKISESDHEQMVKRAKDLNLTISEYVRRLIVVDIAKSNES